MTVISIIIPFYNNEDCLNRCLDSVVNQTHTDLEIICINDGSSDESVNIAKSYVERDSRFTLVSTKNHGAGYARNLGLSIARGDYLLFLDADDFFELNLVEKALLAITENKADICVFRSDSYDYSSKKFSPAKWTINERILPSNCFSPEDVPKNIFKLFVGWAWDKLYSAEFVKRKNLEFQDQRTTNDMLFVFSSLFLADRICVIGDVLAHHQRGATSLANTREKSWTCFYNALLAVKDSLIANDKYERYKWDFINYCLHACLWNLDSLQPPYQEKLYDKVKSEWFDSLGLSELTSKTCYSSKDYATLRRIRSSTYAEYIGDADEKRV